jgi:hypothetical protein
MSTREELEKAVVDAMDALYAADDAKDAAKAEYNTAMAALKAALKAYDKENT